MAKSTKQPVVVIPNLNGGEELIAAVNSLFNQTVLPHVIIVDNASTDGSAQKALEQFPAVELIQNSTNRGYAGGVNPGLARAISLKAPYVAPFNDDAIAHKQWLETLVAYMDAHPEAGAASPKVITSDKERLDSTGDYYTNWGLPYPRGRRSYKLNKYDQDTDIFAASGAACLYRVVALRRVGLLDEDFFAYYEDVDISFRLQLAGWKIAFVPESIVYHHIGMTSARVKGFTTYQTMKNLPLLWYKNVPKQYFWSVGKRLLLAQTLFFGRAISRGQGWPALKGSFQAFRLMYSKRAERKHIQQTKAVRDDYIWGMMVHDLPPNAHALRKLRSQWWRVTGQDETNG